MSQSLTDPSPLGFALLGLMHQEPRSGYALRKVFEDTPMAVFSSSPGSIYPALNKLVIDKLANTSQSRGVPYRITPRGRKTLQQWLCAPPKLEDIERNFDILMLKLALMPGLVIAEDVRSFLISICAHLETNVSVLHAHYRNGHMPDWSRMALGQGVAVKRTQLRWARRALTAVSDNIEEDCA